jgi:hypothetical protein
MTNLNTPDLAPVSFVRSGLTIRGQVHLIGTYAYIDAEQAEWDEDEQIRRYGDVFYRAGIRKGFPPASETYLAPSNRERVEADIEAAAAKKLSARQAEKLTRPTGTTEARRLTPDQTALDSAAKADPMGSAKPGVSKYPRTPAGEDPVPAISPLFTPEEVEERKRLLAETGRPYPWPDDEAATPAVQAEGEEIQPPWDDAASLNVAETRERLARSDEDTVRQFVVWERARVDREPRKSLLGELPEFD